MEYYLRILIDIIGIIIGVLYFVVFIWYARKRSQKISRISKAGKDVIINKKIRLKGWIILVISFSLLPLTQNDFMREHLLLLAIIGILDLILFFYASKLFLKSIEEK